MKIFNFLNNILIGTILIVLLSLFIILMWVFSITSNNAAPSSTKSIYYDTIEVPVEKIKIIYDTIKIKQYIKINPDTNNYESR